MSKSRVKSMLIIFFLFKGNCSQGVCATWTDCESNILRTGTRAFEKQRRVRDEIADKWFLHHDNAPSHTSFAVREYLAQHNITTLRHPQYNPDLAPCDFIFSPSPKPHFKGHHFGQLKTSRQLWRGLWTTSQVKTFCTAMKSGSNAGIAVFDYKEPTLKGISCNWMYVQ